MTVCAWTDHLSLYESRLADGGDQNVGLPGYFRQIAGAAVTDGHGGVSVWAALHEHEGDWLADDFASAEDHDMTASGFNAVMPQKLHNAVGRAG